MATMENFKDMYDVALKPRMLRTLLKEDVPDEKKPFDGPSKLSRVVSVVQTHKLLSESLTNSMDSKLIERWKSSVDEWVNRLLSLVANTTMPDKSWAGICLLGVTCQECSSDRFLASYAVWFDKLLLHIQSPADSQFLKVASCTSMSDLITRLAGFQIAKKDGSFHAGKLIQPILKVLKEDSSEAVWEGALHLLYTVITFFPSSLHRHYDSAEAAITSKIFSGKCSVNMLKKFAHCLSLLPKSRGDEDSWISMMRNILLLVNGYLTEVFQGLEEESKWDEAVKLLVPPGEVPPPSLWGQNLLEDASDKGQTRSKISSVCMLMLCCCKMLTNSYPVQVTVPVRSVLALVERVLMVDGSSPRATSRYVILTEQEFICSELPILHSYSLELLNSVVKCMRSQLLPHAAYTVRLVKEYFKRCALPELRIKVYSIAKILLISMGVGIAIYLAQEVVNNSLLDLNPIGDGTSSSANSKASFEAFLQPGSRKRKHVATGSLEQQHGRFGLEVEAPMNHPRALISVKIAALEALEVLLTVGGALRSESWRSKVDNLIITIATDSCKGGWAYEERSSFLPNLFTSTCADLQLAAFHTLLASLLSPSRVRPPHLARSLELFRRGRLEIGTKLSEFCSHALLALELLIHPRALPLTGFSTASSSLGVNSSFPETIYSGSQKHRNPFASAMQDPGHVSPDSDDDLYQSWLDDSKEIEAPVDTLGKSMDMGKPSETLRGQLGEKVSVAGSSGTMRSEQEPAIASTDVEMRMVELQQFQVSVMQPLEPTFSKGATTRAVTGDNKVSEITLTTVVSDTGASASPDNTITSVEAVMIDKGDSFATGGGSTCTTSLITQKRKTSGFGSDHDSSSDSFPDIIDADPDSD